MATLAAGASASLTLTPGDRVTLEGIGNPVATLTLPNGQVVTVTLQGRSKTLGPFDMTGLATLACAGGDLVYSFVDYEKLPKLGQEADILAVNSAVATGPALVTDSLPDPRKQGGVSAQIVFPGSTSQHVATGIGGRIVVAGSGATNTNAAISVVSASGRKTDAIQGATDAVNLRFADLDKARQPLLVTTGTSAAAIVIEAL